MNEKCDSHDDCLGRIHKRIEAIFEKLDGIKDDLHEWRTAVDVRFVQIEMRLALCEKAIAERSEGRSDVKQKLVAGAIDILKTGILFGIGAAAWAVANGYRG